MARSVISAGAIIQFAKTVSIKGLGLPAAFFTSPKAMPSTVGYIMKKRQMPMGIEIWENLRESRYSPKLGRYRPSSNPTTMQMPIQTVRYFSKIPSLASF